MGGKLTETLVRIGKTYITWNRSLNIFFSGLMAVLCFLVAIKLAIDFKLYGGFLVLGIVLVLLAVTVWIVKNIEKPGPPTE
jgi:hypothetical protein